MIQRASNRGRNSSTYRLPNSLFMNELLVSCATNPPGVARRSSISAVKGRAGEYLPLATCGYAARTRSRTTGSFGVMYGGLATQAW